MLAWFRYFCRKSVSRAEDVHLTQFWSILTKQSRGSGLCLFWPATTAMISRPLIGQLDPVRASHWLITWQTVTADDPII